MKKRFIIFYIAAFCIVVGLSFAMPASSAILFYEDFEDALDFDPPRDWVKEGKHGSQGLTTEQVRAGSSAYKFSLTRYDSGDFREQITLHNGFNNGSLYFTIGNEYWIGYSLFLADGYHSPTVPGGWVLHQEFHPVADACDEGIRHAIFHHRTKDGNWTSWLQWTSLHRTVAPKVGIFGNYYTYDPFSTGQWVDFVINVKWSYEAEGVFKIWKNGVLITDRNGPNCFNDDTGPYLMLGIYGRIDQDQTMTIYCDELRIGDSNSSYSEVAPGGTVKPLPPMVYPPEKIIDK